MFHTNREKFNTTTDFDESKYTYVFIEFDDMIFQYLSHRNVPVRQMSATELADIEKKVQEIERGIITQDIDEDDAGNQRNFLKKIKIIRILLQGVKRPSESHNLDDSNSNTRTNRSNRNDFRYDTEYNPSK